MGPSRFTRLNTFGSVQGRTGMAQGTQARRLQLESKTSAALMRSARQYEASQAEIVEPSAGVAARTMRGLVIRRRQSRSDPTHRLDR